MTKSDLQKLIRQEITAVVKAELPKMVKPMVQEAVAGALAGLLAEGIVKGAPKSQVLTPNIPQARGPASPGGRQAAPARGLDPRARRELAEKMGYGSGPDRIGPAGGFVSNGNVLDDILAETAGDMRDGNFPVDSVLDNLDDLSGVIAPEAVDAITRDYSDLMSAMNRRGRLNG